MKGSRSGVEAVAAGAIASQKGDVTTVPFAQRLTCSIKEACQATSISRAKLYQLISNGSVSSRTVGRRRVVDVQSLKSLFLKDG